ncbi:YkgJ family cysteine cluster protein [Halorubrum vacuolatum]|uniref:Uncharacterized protein n=1 Tax=Halorubrum vacuolatum TaxID=63740 RepID=A0A238W132_HALVU|nr:YkgJ family cysteine cluster protein [Halorubrum vacuolatum]SNR40270.1 hypothetical protein SAMN06264855_10523 [Halorubrum vacuolatum]
MESLEAELARARDLDVDALADAIESIGFECTRCGACCKGYDPGADPESVQEGDGATETGERDEHGDGCHDPTEREPHTATVFPDEVRDLMGTAAVDGDPYDWRDVARPMPYGLHGTAAGDVAGETFEWALAVDDCGDCTFYTETDGQGACTVHEDRPLVCRTYPFSVALGGTSQPMGEPVDSVGMVRAHECEGLGRAIDRAEAEEFAAQLKRRAIRELEEAIGVRDRYDPRVGAESDADVVVFDSEGPKRADGTPIDPVK